MADSTVAGYLTPSTEPVDDAELANILQKAIRGITDLPGALVRPRWQPEPPQQPAFEVNWCAFGVVRVAYDKLAFYKQVSQFDAEVYRDTLFDVLHSFYGPSCTLFARRLIDGLSVPQNRDELERSDIAVVTAGDLTHLPALLKERWVDRVDVEITFRRRTLRTYAIRTIQSANVRIDNEVFVTNIDVPPRLPSSLTVRPPSP